MLTFLQLGKLNPVVGYLADFSFQNSEFLTRKLFLLYIIREKLLKKSLEFLSKNPPDLVTVTTSRLPDMKHGSMEKKKMTYPQNRESSIVTGFLVAH